jgi:NifU-like protein involved in Fe-S cluster formation
VNVGTIPHPTVQVVYTGPCGDTLELYLKIDSNRIRDAKFQANGCIGTFSSGSALTEMIKGRDIKYAKGLSETDLRSFLEGAPKQMIHCPRLAMRTLRKALKEYKTIKL